MAVSRGHRELLQVLADEAALHVAAQQGHDEFVKLLLEQGAAANRVDGAGRLPEELAGDAGHHELAGLLEAARGDGPRHDSQELFDAIQRRDHTAVRAWFEQGGPVDVRGLPAGRQSQPASGRDERGFRLDLETPLYAAVRADDATLVRLLLEQGADAEARVHGRLALEHAVSPHINLPVMQMLLERTNPVHLPKLVSRPLRSRKNLDAGLAAALLLHYADGHVNDQQSREWIVEAIAANEDRADVLEVLLLYLQPEPQTLGELQRRAPGGRWQCGRLLETYADTEPATWQRRAAYFFALVGGDEKAVAELLAEGADPNQRFLAMPGQRMRSDLKLRREASAPDVRPALHIAAVLGHVGLIEILMDKGAQINATDPLGATALQAAAHHGQTESLQALIAAGADLEQRTDVGLIIGPFPDLIGTRSPSSAARFIWRQPPGRSRQSGCSCSTALSRNLGMTPARCRSNTPRKPDTTT